MRKKTIFLSFCRVVVALVLITALFSTFMASPQSVFIFTKLRISTFWKINIGITELIAVIFLLRSNTYVQGAVMAIVLMLFALITHIFVIGIKVLSDNGWWFISALLVLFCSICILWLSRASIAPAKNNAVPYNQDDPFHLEDNKNIKNWLVPSIIVLIVLSFPVGLVSLIYAVESKIKLRRMDFAGAQKASNMAGIAAKTGGLIGLATILVVIILAAIKNF